MHPRTAISAVRREEGFSLIELLVAIALIGVIMSGLAFGITGSLSVTRDSRERTVAANLASAEIDLANAAPANNLQEGTLRRVERVGVTDFTIVRESRWENGVTDALACTALANSASGRGRRFLQVNVSVSWEGIGLRRPVLASTAITPSVASYRTGFGHVAVTVTDRDGGPVPAITVTLSGAVTRHVTTTAIGCAFFTDVPPGAYTVSVDQPGYVDADPEDAAQLGSEAVTVADRETTKAAFTYDNRAALSLALSSPNGGNALDGVPIVAEANAATKFTRYSACAAAPVDVRPCLYGSAGAAGRTIGATPSEGLFPYTGGWTAWAGCEHNDPLDYGGTRLGLNPTPGSTATGSVVAGTLRMRISRPDSTRSNEILYATDQLAPPGSPCAVRIPVGTFLANGTLSRDVVLPFGDWRLYVGLSADHLNVDDDLVDGLIQVRPGVVATYQQPLTFPGAVLADGPWLYYRLGETPSAGARDSSGNNRTGTYQAGVTRGVAGPLTGESNPGIALNGTTSAYVSTPTQLTNPTTFSLEVWFQTTSTTGGRLAGFGNAQTGQSGQYDRHLYLSNAGQLYWGAYPGAVRTVNSTAAYNDGAWHHAVGTLSATGLRLYVDGALVASRTDTTAGQSYSGYFRLGYDNLGGWTAPPSNFAFTGAVDEFAYYPSALSAARVTAHYAARTGAYGSAVLADAPAVHYRFNDALVAEDSSGNNRDGAYQTGVTGGAAGALPADTDTAAAFTAAGVVSNGTLTSSPTSFSLEAWVNTTSTRGGRIVGFGNLATGTSATTDRLLYLRNNGRVLFGVHPTTRTTITSPAASVVNDGEWHHIVATYQPSGMVLYIDGVQVASRGTTASGTAYNGYWRVGGDTLSSWTQVPSDASLAGVVDEVAVYHSVLPAAQVAAHYAASGR